MRSKRGGVTLRYESSSVSPCPIQATTNNGEQSGYLCLYYVLLRSLSPWSATKRNESYVCAACSTDSHTQRVGAGAFAGACLPSFGLYLQVKQGPHTTELLWFLFPPRFVTDRGTKICGDLFSCLLKDCRRVHTLPRTRTSRLLFIIRRSFGIRSGTGEVKCSRAP